MSIRKTIGGNRLNSGKKMKVDLKSYERSTHDTSYAFRSTMATGTLVPCLVRPILPGSTVDIEIDAKVFTNPTIGPLFGNYDLNVEVFKVPMRLYMARLHNNESGLGMDMKNVFLPQYEFETAKNYGKIINDIDNSQVNPSCILSYLGFRGAGVGNNNVGESMKREVNAIPYLAYWEIVKNYYANQQEEKLAVIHNEIDLTIEREGILTVGLNTPINVHPNVEYKIFMIGEDTKLEIKTHNANTEDINLNNIYVTTDNGTRQSKPIKEVFNKVTIETKNDLYWIVAKGIDKQTYFISYQKNTTDTETKIKLVDIKNVDRMKRNILQQEYESPLKINKTSLEPYNLPLKFDIDSGNGSALNSQEGLALRTYKNDLLNNWMNTEWIDGENGINSITAVKIVDDKLEIPSLILAKKVFNVLNRIALSGGTYDDWLEVTYDHERISREESPIYVGGLIKEIVFEEVVSNSASETENNVQPLGTIAGKGVMGSKHKGGYVTIKTDEPAYIIAIASITPKIDYSQGNQWDVNLKNMDELHKPELDGIGFQDLITEQMAWWDTIMQGDINSGQHTVFQKSAGKQPAWINYQTAINKTYGDFAIEDNMMWMTLNRRYEPNYVTNELNTELMGIKDLTSYIDPEKFNNIFSYRKRDAQNFKVQIGFGIQSRMKMSAKIMPNI